MASKKVIGSFFGFVFVAFGLTAQNINVGGVFPTLDHSGQISDKFSYNAYIFGAVNGYENQDNRVNLHYYYLENGLSYHLNKHLTFTSAYVFERQNIFKSHVRNEHRLFQQITLKHAYKNFSFKNRLRFDERFIQNNGTERYDFNSRIRYLFGLNYTLNTDWYVMSYSEFFFQTSKGAKFQFNENWSAMQLGYSINKNNAIEMGYLFVGWVLNPRMDWLNQHYLQATWVNKINFRKNK